MTFSEAHALDVATPSGVLLAEQLAPDAPGPARERLARYLAEFIATSIRAYCEFHPPAVVPEPSPN